MDAAAASSPTSSRPIATPCRDRNQPRDRAEAQPQWALLHYRFRPRPSRTRGCRHPQRERYRGAPASDPDNVFVSLSTRGKNPAIRIHARAATEAGLRHLKLAGAVASSRRTTSAPIAAPRPSAVDFLTLVLPGRGAETSLKEVNVPSHSPLIGLTIAAVERDNARWRVVGLKRGADPTSIIPDLQTAIVTGGPIVVIGARQRLAHLAQSAT
jgi:hypothetical protein